jgi:hypothetical protein
MGSIVDPFSYASFLPSGDREKKNSGDKELYLCLPLKDELLPWGSTDTHWGLLFFFFMTVVARKFH